jgi:glutamate synthase domain-containing protein 3
MSGGIAYVLDESGEFPVLVNREMVELEDLSDEADEQAVLDLVRRHVKYTSSARGQYVLDNWEQLKSKFVKVMPVDYKRALVEMKKQKAAAAVAV